MVPIAIYADRALTPLEEIRDAALLVEEGKIAAIGRRGELALPASVQEYSARGMTVVPGFIDVHIHGAGGSDVMEETPEALAYRKLVIYPQQRVSALRDSVGAG